MAGRNARKSSLHSALAFRGAFFTCVGGCEVAQFYLPELGSSLKVPGYDWYGNYGHKGRSKPSKYEEVHDEYAGWTVSPRVSEAIRNEVMACRKDVVISDISHCGKIEVSGQQAESFLNRICTALLENEQATPKATPTLMLNASAGTVSEAVVIRADKDKFYLSVPVSVPKSIIRHMKGNIKFGEDVFVNDVTDDFTVLTIQGPQSRALLSRVTSEPVDAESFPKYSMQELALGSEAIPCRIINISSVGENGYELHVTRDKAQNLLTALLGVKPDLTFAGLEALDSMSLEVRPRPEAQLKFACKAKLEDGQAFIGKEAAQAQIRNGVAQKAVHFTTDPEVNLTGKELIYRNDQLIGLISKGGFSYTLNKGLATGIIRTPDQSSITDGWITQGQYELEVFGQKYPAQVHVGPLYLNE